MDIQFNGAIITYALNETEDVHKLMCTCGHPLWQHASYVQYYYPDAQHNTAYQSQCTACGFAIDDKTKKDVFVCEKFRLK